MDTNALLPPATFLWSDPPTAGPEFNNNNNKKIRSHDGSRGSEKSQPIFAATEKLANESGRSKESLKAVRSRLVSRQGSRATRRSRASIESRGPFSSNEDLDIDVDDVEDLELPPNILADNWDSSAPPSSRSAERPWHRSSSSRKPRKWKRGGFVSAGWMEEEPMSEAAGVQQKKKNKKERKRGFRARLRRLLGQDREKSKAGHESPYGHEQTRDLQSDDSRLSGEQDAAAQ
ncbi:hypothetical protein CORC01_01144 [Colletotrichum orchidophilum]|uniref:Uncharacterized protein n=1 Tax=Colletotrichum orchidophilum TaxID=1209926 RepID=A0A1G4BQ30_9PEZI|nr:uncharacterized protein CORC01_01144 [Colletotrichum orchidophilum]OHF03425.1 hypothetical protein CORC01_01144 [Colletotrichum orchidophilum]